MTLSFVTRTPAIVVLDQSTSFGRQSREAGSENGLSPLAVGVKSLARLGKPIDHCLIVGLAAAQVLLQNLSGDTRHEGRRGADHWRPSFGTGGIVRVGSRDSRCIFRGTLCKAFDCLVCELLRIRGGGEVEEAD